MRDASLPLSRIKVLDLTRVLAGPCCTMALGDLGARVLKVERPGTGDETRGWGPPFDADGTSAYFLSVNRNKLSVALDFDDPADRERAAPARSPTPMSWSRTFAPGRSSDAV